MADPQEIQVTSQEMFTVRQNIELAECEQEVVIKLPSPVAAGKVVKLKIAVDGELDDAS